MFTKITETDLANKGVTGLPDTPNLSTMEMQAKFDELAKDVVVPKFNNLVDELDEKDLDNVTHSEDITDFKLDADGRMQVSTDGGETYGYAGSTGHQIMDGSGTRYPARANLQFSQNVSITDYDEENGNKTFLSVVGEKGERGDGATIRVGTVESADTPSIENVGSLTDAIFNFKLPKGDDGDSATVAIGSVTKGENASVYNSGTSSNAVFNFVLPKGDKGDTGQGINILGEYETLAELQLAHPTGQRGDAYMVGTDNPKDLYAWDIDHNLWQNQGALQGAKGDKGDSATISVGSVSEGSTMGVENVGTSTDAIFNFTLKKGDKGDQGNTGTIAVGNVTSGENASVTNVGTSTQAVFDFVIPRGEKGDQGSPTVINGKSGANVTLYGTDIYTSNQDGAYTVSQEISNLHTEIAENGGGSVIRVTFDEDQSGNTITFAIDGMDTITKVVPSVEPRMIEISTKEMGVMTITDTTISKSITLTIDTYELYTVPFASGFDYQEWLTLGNVSGTYASLEEVLADEKALRQLFNKHASVDYLVECCSSDLDESVETIINTDLCAKWINLRDYALDTLYANTYIASAMDTADKYFYGEWVLKDNVWQPKGNVPIMTSNNAPYGEAIGSSNYSGASSNFCYAFKGNTSAPFWVSNTNDSVGAYVGYKFVNPICVKAFLLTSHSDRYTTSAKIQGSNDGTNWTDASATSIDVSSSKDSNTITYKIENDTYYLYYRFYVNSFSGSAGGLNNVVVKQLQFYGRELKVSVPKMDGNNSPWGEAFQYKGNFQTENASITYKCFDKDPDSYNHIVNSTSSYFVDPSNSYIGYKFNYPVLLKSAYVKDISWSKNNVTNNVVVEASNDNQTWDVISNEIAFTHGSTNNTWYEITTNIAYSYFRIKPTTHVESFGFTVNEILFFGLDYSEHEERHWIYDHGVEVESETCNTTNGWSGATYIEPTYNGDYVQLSAQASSYCGIGSKDTVNLEDYVIAKALIEGGVQTSNEYGGVNASAKNLNNPIAQKNILSPHAPLVYVDISNANSGNVAIWSNNTRSLKVYEFWVE